MYNYFLDIMKAGKGKDPKVKAYEKKLLDKAKEKTKKHFGKTSAHDEKMITDEELETKINRAGGAKLFVELVMEF